jgi:hypothetical protein
MMWRLSITLYHGSGAGDFQLLDVVFSEKDLAQRKYTAARLLRERGNTRAAEILMKYPFVIYNATNGFADDFSVLSASVPLVHYEELREGGDSGSDKAAIKQIATALGEMGTYIRFISAELEMEVPPEIAKSTARQPLGKSEILRLVSGYIGVAAGYLGDFSYGSHQKFYAELDLDIDPAKYTGTTKDRFIEILSRQAPDIQVRILVGVLKKYPAGSSELRTQEKADEVRSWIARLASVNGVAQPILRITSDVVERALADAEQLIKSTGAVSGVDRVHTALHGYLGQVCMDASISADKDLSITELFKLIREQHPVFAVSPAGAEEIMRIIRAMSTIVDAINTLRNRVSMAHPNPVLLEEPEAMLAINLVRAILHYFDSKIHIA